MGEFTTIKRIFTTQARGESVCFENPTYELVEVSLSPFLLPWGDFSKRRRQRLDTTQLAFASGVNILFHKIPWGFEPELQFDESVQPKTPFTLFELVEKKRPSTKKGSQKGRVMKYEILHIQDEIDHEFKDFTT